MLGFIWMWSTTNNHVNSPCKFACMHIYHTTCFLLFYSLTTAVYVVNRRVSMLTVTTMAHYHSSNSFKDQVSFKPFQNKCLVSIYRNTVFVFRLRKQCCKEIEARVFKQRNTVLYLQWVMFIPGSTELLIGDTKMISIHFI